MLFLLTTALQTHLNDDLISQLISIFINIYNFFHRRAQVQPQMHLRCENKGGMSYLWMIIKIGSRAF